MLLMCEIKISNALLSPFAKNLIWTSAFQLVTPVYFTEDVRQLLFWAVVCQSWQRWFADE